MAGEYNAGAATTTDIDGTITDFSIDPQVTDGPGNQKETYWDYPDAAQNLGYYKNIPEIKSALKALAIWTVGKGWSSDSRTKAILQSISGWGEDSFQSIMMNLIIQKKVFGDAFAEIIRDGEDGRIINIKPLYPGDMRVVVKPDGIISHYMQRNGATNVMKRLETQQVLHLVNDRIGNEIHGISIIESLKTIIDAKNEALADEKKIRHRELALGVMEVDTDDTTKISTAITTYQNAVNNGEVLVLPKGVAEIKDNLNKGPRDRIQWLQYLDNLFYQVVGIPKVMVTSEGFTEAGGKVGFMTFEPTYTSEQVELEDDLWNQCAIKLTFNRPPSLLSHMQDSEVKNTGQTGFQPNEVNVGVERSE